MSVATAEVNGKCQKDNGAQTSLCINRWIYLILRTGAGSRSFSHLDAVAWKSEKPRPRSDGSRGRTNNVPGELQRVTAAYY